MNLQKLVLVFLVLFPLFATAQDRTESELMLAIFKSEKAEVVREYLGLYREYDDPKFWRVYEAYESKRKNLSRQRMALISQYSKTALQLNSEKAKNIAQLHFKTHKQMLKLRKQYYKKMAKAVGATKAIEFVQMEEYIDMLIQTEVMQMLPFVGE